MRQMVHGLLSAYSHEATPQRHHRSRLSCLCRSVSPAALRSEKLDVLISIFIYIITYIYITIPGITKKNALLGNLQKKSDLQKNSQRLGSELPIQLALVPRTCIERAYPSPHP